MSVFKVSFNVPDYCWFNAAYQVPGTAFRVFSSPSLPRSHPCFLFLSLLRPVFSPHIILQSLVASVTSSYFKRDSTGRREPDVLAAEKTLLDPLESYTWHRSWETIIVTPVACLAVECAKRCWNSWCDEWQCWLFLYRFLPLSHFCFSALQLQWCLTF